MELGDNGPLAQVEIESMEDFHPDRLLKDMKLFKALREQRKRVANAETFAQEIALSQAVKNKDETPSVETETSESSGDATSNLLGAAIDLAQAQQIPLEQRIAAGTVDWEEYVREIGFPVSS